MPPRNWVFLRGLGRESRHWGKFLEDFKKSFPQDEVLTLDLPGAGKYYQNKSPLSVASMVKFLRKKVESEATNSPTYLFAVSLGAMVGFEWMTTYPDDFAGGIFINSSLSGLNPFYQRLRWQIYPEFFPKVILQKGVEREKAILSAISNRKDLHEDLSQEWAKIAESQPISTKNILSQLIAAARFRKEKRIEKPILLIASYGDNFVSYHCSEAIAKKFNYPIVYHNWGGHDLTTDDSEWVTDQVKNWLESL